ncbi:MAG: hypothetical protein KIT54_04045 [Phycisphaeraceae bacterium]|nr:hypothetical protein [Phycisphaeraceae bacterium]
MPSEQPQDPLADRLLARRICLVVLVIYAIMLVAQGVAYVGYERWLLPWMMWSTLTMFAIAAFAQLTGRSPVPVPDVFRKRELHLD